MANIAGDDLDDLEDATTAMRVAAYFLANVPVNSAQRAKMEAKAAAAKKAAAESGRSASNPPPQRSSSTANTQDSPSRPSMPKVADSDSAIPTKSALPGQTNPFRQPVYLHSHTNPTPITVLATLDTGTADNYISRRIVNRARLQTQPERVEQMTTFDGGRFETSGQFAAVTWYGDGSSQTREDKFHVVEEGPFDILFGWQLLLSHEILNFNDSALLLVQPRLSPEKIDQIEQRRQQHAATSNRLALERPEQAVAAITYPTNGSSSSSNSQNDQQQAYQTYSQNWQRRQ
jgi:hypothetical protein